MSLSFFLTLLVVPPVNLAVVALAAAAWPHRRLARRVGFAAALLLVALAMPVTGKLLLSVLDVPPPATPVAPQAIIVLGADISEGRTPNGGPDFSPGPFGLDRLRAAAALARRTGLPLLITGGSLHPGGPAVSAVMAASLTHDFGMQARWIEPAAADTWQNAQFSADMLRAEGIGAAYVVTQGWHMRRAMIAFARTGLAAVPAATQRDPAPLWDWREFVPYVTGWVHSYYALHEIIGCAAYGLRAWRT